MAASAACDLDISSDLRPSRNSAAEAVSKLKMVWVPGSQLLLPNKPAMPVGMGGGGPVVLQRVVQVKVPTDNKVPQ